MFIPSTSDTDNTVVFPKLEVTLNIPILPHVKEQTVILTLRLFLDNVDNDTKLTNPPSSFDEILVFIVINRAGPYL